MSSKIYRKFKTLEDRRGFYLLKNVRKAILDYQMIQPQDRILLGLSGGKDSLSLLKMLKLFRKIYLIPFEIVPIIVLSELQEAIRKNIPALQKFVEDEGMHLIIKEIEIHLPEKAKEQQKNLCFYCSWHRRKTLFESTREFQCSKVALGHHADDIAETILMNLFVHGRIERMEPRMSFFDGEFTLIRPLAYLDEKDIIQYANSLSVQLMTCTCPLGSLSKRHLMKETIKELEKNIPKLKVNLFRACENDDFVPLRKKKNT